jgi:hypothetical protein
MFLDLGIITGIQYIPHTIQEINVNDVGLSFIVFHCGSLKLRSPFTTEGEWYKTTGQRVSKLVDCHHSRSLVRWSQSQRYILLVITQERWLKSRINTSPER